MGYSIRDIAQIILHVMTGFIPAVLFYSVIVMFIIRAIGGSENARPADFYPNKHVYHPQRVFTYYKVVIYVATAISLCFVLPYVVMYIMFYVLYPLAFPVAALTFIAGVVITIKLIKRPDPSVMVVLTVDSSAVTATYRGGGTATYACRNYAGYKNPGAAATIFVFRNEYGAESELRVTGLPAGDLNMLRDDLDRVRQTGNIAVIKPAVAKPNAAVPVTQNVGATVTQNTGYDNPRLYAEYLKEEAAKLSAEQRLELVNMIEAGDKLNAIKCCREWTNLGLKMAKDIVDSYHFCLLGSDVRSMAGTAAAATPVPAAASIAPAVTASPVLPPEIPAVASNVSASEIPSVASNVSPAEIPTVTSNVSPTEIGTVTSAEIPTVTPTAADTFMSQITATVSAPVTSISGFDFGMTQAVQGSGSWTLRITDKEQTVTDARSLERNIDNTLSEIGRKNEESLVLAPAEPVRGITFMQVCQDKNDVYFHLEAGLTEMNSQGRPKILCKDKLMGWEARNLCLSFYRGDEIYMSDWYELS
ncbi:MAG: hypothetical protein K6B44_07905 [Lachnospiraceae bacterium]|nr:hypothetical protein [Lachnospiraceae bacterium]